MELSVSFTFAAAHRLPLHRGRCFNMHGHNYRLVVTVAGEPDPLTGMVMDFADLEGAVERAAIARMRGACLNDFIDTPTAENICAWAWDRLAPAVPGLARLVLYETERYWVTRAAPPAAPGAAGPP